MQATRNASSGLCNYFFVMCSCSQVCEAAAEKRAAECAEAAEGGKGKCEAPAEAMSSSDKSSVNEAADRTNAHWDHYAGTTLLSTWQHTSPSFLSLTARTLFSIHMKRATSLVYLCQHHCQSVRFFQTATNCQYTPIHMSITKSVQ